MSGLSAERVAALQDALLRSTLGTCDLVECDPYGNAVIHAEALAPLIAGWLAEAWEDGHRGLCRRHGVVPFEACRNPYRGGTA